MPSRCEIHLPIDHCQRDIRPVPVRRDIAGHDVSGGVDVEPRFKTFQPFRACRNVLRDQVQTVDVVAHFSLQHGDDQLHRFVVPEATANQFQSVVVVPVCRVRLALLVSDDAQMHVNVNFAIDRAGLPKCANGLLGKAAGSGEITAARVQPTEHREMMPLEDGFLLREFCARLFELVQELVGQPPRVVGVQQRFDHHHLVRERTLRRHRFRQPVNHRFVEPPGFVRPARLHQDQALDHRQPRA